MAVPSSDKDMVESSQSVESVPSPPSASKRDSDAGSETSSMGVAGSLGSADRNGQPNSSVEQRKDVEIQTPEQVKSEEYRQLFRLPPEEVLIQDFNCASQDGLLIQGHMYLFFHHICFYSNIFGFETKKIIPLHEVTFVRKAKTAAIFPNAIEIVAGEKRHFFASFLSRDEAYRLIIDGWSQHGNGAKSSIDQQESKTESGGQEKVLEISEKPECCERNNDSHILEECKLLTSGEDEISESMSLLEEKGNEGDAEPVLNFESSCIAEPILWKLEDTDAPKIPEHYTMIAESRFPIKVEDFFSYFFSDVSFAESFHRTCGDTDFRCSSWYWHEQFGHARDISFRHPIKITFGPRFGSCQQVQKFRVYRNSHLVIETSQEIIDIPYGDYFRVQGLWDVQNGANKSNNCCILRVYLNVAFSKKTMWKGKIEHSTVEESREAYSAWINSAHELLKQKSFAAPEEGSPAASAIENHEVHSESDVRSEEPLEMLHQERNHPRIPQITPNSKDASPLVGDFMGKLSDLSIKSSIRESLVIFCSYMKSQSHLPLILATTFIVILLLTQLSILVLLSRPPQVHLISQVDYMNRIDNGGGDRDRAVAWLEKRIHHLKDEMLIVESRLEKMHQEHNLLKKQIQDLEQLETRKPPNHHFI